MESLIFNPQYAIYFFDCDGVLLDSNWVKAKAMFEATRSYGEEQARLLVEHHLSNEGIPRETKFHYFFRSILNLTDYEAEYDAALAHYGTLARTAVASCGVMPGARELLDKLSRLRPCYVISGAAEDEVRFALDKHGLGRYFAGIYGGPRSKDDIVEGILSETGESGAGVVVGDARYDHEVAERFGLDFVFVNQCTKFAEWPNYFAHKKVRVVSTLVELDHSF